MELDMQNVCNPKTTMDGFKPHATKQQHEYHVGRRRPSFKMKNSASWRSRWMSQWAPAPFAVFQRRRQAAKHFFKRSAYRCASGERIKSSEL
jgi:hypothetical protein